MGSIADHEPLFPHRTQRQHVKENLNLQEKKSFHILLFKLNSAENIQKAQVALIWLIFVLPTLTSLILSLFDLCLCFSLIFLCLSFNSSSHSSLLLVFILVLLVGPLAPPPPSMQITPQLPLMGFVARVQETSK